MNHGRMPSWEGDFWAELMEEQGVFMDDRPMGATTGRFAATGGPEGMSPYWTDDTLVGEIVEDEQLGISAN
jgi:hypothetical protein